MGYVFRLAARVILYASSHRQDNTYHGLCYTIRGTLARTRNSSMGTSKGSLIAMSKMIYAGRVGTMIDTSILVVSLCFVILCLVRFVVL